MNDAAIHEILGTVAALTTMAIGGLMTWMFWVQRSMLTRKEHERICLEHHRETLDKLDDLEHFIEKNDVRATKSREELQEKVSQVVIDVAVLKDRAGLGNAS